jgi:hypothetical protein
MLGLSIADLVYVIVTAIFSGAVLNKWIFQKFPNHIIQKLSSAFAVLIFLLWMSLTANNNPISIEIAGYLFIICTSILTGVFFDSIMDHWVKFGFNFLKRNKKC